MKLNYKTRQVSTESIYNAFDPPLIFTVKARAANGWGDLAEQLEESGIVDISLAAQVMTALCLSVSDSEMTQMLLTVDSAKEFHAMLKGAIPDMANEIFCQLAYNLALDYINEKKIELKQLSERLELSTNGNKENVAVLES